MPRICVSQPTLDVPSPTRKEILESLLPYRFVNISDDAFLNFETRILLTDAAPRNVRIVDGTPALFDAIASFAPDKICEWASLRSNTPPTIADAGVSTRTNQSGFDVGECVGHGILEGFGLSEDLVLLNGREALPERGLRCGVRNGAELLQKSCGLLVAFRCHVGRSGSAGLGNDLGGAQ